MKSFLQDLALEIRNNFNERTGELCLVFPTRRAGLFFQKELAQLYDGPIWSPKIYSIQDYLLKLAAPCSSAKKSGAEEYYNRSEVKKAFHVDENIYWKQCNSDLLKGAYTISDKGSYYLYPKLISSKLKIWIFSGDTDIVVPFNSTSKWIKKLNLPILSNWSSWGNENTSFFYGYIQEYYGLSYITFRNVGHMVPQWKRKESYLMFDSFINNKKLN